MCLYKNNMRFIILYIIEFITLSVWLWIFFHFLWFIISCWSCVYFLGNIFYTFHFIRILFNIFDSVFHSKTWCPRITYTCAYFTKTSNFFTISFAELVFMFLMIFYWDRRLSTGYFSKWIGLYHPFLQKLRFPFSLLLHCMFYLFVWVWGPPPPRASFLLNPFNAESILIQSSRTQIILKTI